MTSVVKLIEVVVEIASVVLTESKKLLTVELDEAACAGKTKTKFGSISICLKCIEIVLIVETS